MQTPQAPAGNREAGSLVARLPRRPCHPRGSASPAARSWAGLRCCPLACSGRAARLRRAACSSAASHQRTQGATGCFDSLWCGVGHLVTWSVSGRRASRFSDLCQQAMRRVHVGGHAAGRACGMHTAPLLALPCIATWPYGRWAVPITGTSMRSRYETMQSHPPVRAFKFMESTIGS